MSPFLVEKFLIFAQKSKILHLISFLLLGNDFAPFSGALSGFSRHPSGCAARRVAAMWRVIIIFARDILERTTDDRDD